jgi:hypothetical protein
MDKRFETANVAKYKKFGRARTTNIGDTNQTSQSASWKILNTLGNTDEHLKLGARKWQSVKQTKT